MLRLSVKDPRGERRFVTERYEVLVGCRDGVDLKLDDPGISRNHCLLRVEGDRVRLVDLGSEGGTHVRGLRADQAMLDPGQEFTLGSTTIRVESFEGPPLPLPTPPVVAAAVARPAAPGPPPPPPPARAPAGPAAPVATGAHPDFAREVRALLRRTPWYGISLALHILALLVLDLIPWEVRTESRSLRLEASLPDAVLDAEEGTDFEEPKLEEIAPEVQPEEELDPENPDPASRESPGDLEREFELATPPDAVGAGRGLKIIKIAALPTKDVTGAGETLRTGDLDGEHRSAQKAVERRLGDGIRDARRKRSKADIVVVRGDFDSIELVLDAYEWPHTLIDREELIRRTFPAAELLFINCARRPPPADRAKLVSVVKSFIQRGGWVVTSDWSIDPYLAEAFPDRVELLKPKRRQPDTTVTVHPVAMDELLGGAFSRRTDSTWWIEETSTLFKVRGDVDELVTSEDLERRFGARTVVFRLRYGRGMALHLLGHFYQKDGNRIGLVGMHTLINNVILARFDTGR